MSNPSDLSRPAIDRQAQTTPARRAERCVHVKQNGVRCGSPALKSQPWCYFHERYYNRPYEDSMPVLEDANAIQIAIMQVFDGLRSGRIDTKTANTYIYGLKVAAFVNRQANFSPHPSRIVLEDPLLSDRAGVPTIAIPNILPSVQASADRVEQGFSPAERVCPPTALAVGKSAGAARILSAEGPRAGRSGDRSARSATPAPSTRAPSPFRLGARSLGMTR
jgi:hypothetical protein